MKVNESGTESVCPGQAAARSVQQPRPALQQHALAACGLLVALVALTRPVQGQVVVTDTGAPVSSFMAPLSMPLLERAWVSYVGADRGLGFQGQYFTLGGIAPLTTDVASGTWFVDGRAHLTTDNTQFFSNIGLVRRGYIDAINSIFGVSGWYDYDGDNYRPFGYRYNQFGATGEIFNPAFDFRINGYFPVGQQAHVLDGFTQNYLLFVNGIDTAFHGFDSKFSLRPAFMASWNGYIDIGGYAYKSPIFNTLGGVSTGFGVQPIPGLAINMEVNHDAFFGTTGFIQVAFGLGGTPGNSRTGNRLLEPVRRNDHIVRFNQQPQIATDPVTGAFYHVIHVDNNAPPGGNGTVEHPFNSLAAAQAASAVHDIIYVHTGDGTARNYNMGITLKDDQQLLGSGNSYVMQSTEVGPFLLHALNSVGPVITNPAGAAVTLANDDRVGGMTITGAQFGIVGNLVTNFSMEQNRIINSGIDAVFLNSFSGTAHFRANTITDNLEDGIHIFGGSGSFDVQGNTIEANIRDGLFFDGTTGTANVMGNTLGANGRGNFAGLRVNTDSGTFTIDVSHNDVEGNTEGIWLESYNPGTLLTATVHDNPLIRYNLGDGIQIAARSGSTLNFAILNNPAINFNGQFPTAKAGAGIRLYDADSVLSGTINGNAIINNAGNGQPLVTSEGQGIQGLFVGDAITGLTMIGNSIDGQGTFLGVSTPTSPTGHGVLLDYESTNSVVQTLFVQDNNIINNKGLGFIVLTGETNVLDASFTHNFIAHNFDNGLTIGQASGGATRVTLTNNTIINNVSSLAPDIGALGASSGVGLFSAGGNLVAVLNNNVISNNGQDGHTNPPIGSFSTVNGITAQTDGFGTMALEILGNQINNNGNHAIALTAMEGFINPVPRVPLPALPLVTLGAIIRDNMMENNHGTSSLLALTPTQAPPVGPNRSFIAVELTHNESSLPYIFRNTQQPPDTALIAFADGGLNAGLIEVQGNTTTLGTIIQTDVATIDTLVAPLLVFP